MQKREITSKYLRLRVSSALLVIMAAAFASHQIAKTAHRNVVATAEVSNTFDEVQAAIVDFTIHVHAIGGAADAGRAGAIRTGMRRSLRNLNAVSTQIAGAQELGFLSAGARKLLQSDTLDALGEFSDFLLIAEVLAKPDGPWGLGADRFVDAASSATDRLLPILRRLKKLQREDISRANESLSNWSDLTFVLIALVLGGSSIFIFRPLERRIIEAQEEINRKKQLAEDASEAKSHFLATMSHEIRTPMNGVLGMAELLLQSRLDDKQRKMIGVINQSGRSLLSIINDILDFSKIEAHKLQLFETPFDLRETAHQLFELLKPQAEEKGLVFRLTIDEALGVAHLGDEGRVRQVLTNLVGNALKFTREGSVEISVRAEPAVGGRQEIHLCVTDTGIGVSEEKLMRIFYPFEQADSTTTRSFGGTGLGLAISVSLAEAMGGDLKAESELGRGSNFSLNLSLPVVRAIASELAHIEPNATRVRGERSRILVAEDNEVNQFVISQMLGMANCEVILACDGKEAVALYAEVQPNLVFMDVSMPVMDGYAATRAVRDHERATGADRTPVIALTAHVMPSHLELCLTSGMDAVLTKPVSVDDLHRLLREHLPDAPLKLSA